MTEQTAETKARISIPVAIVLERTLDTSKKWIYPSWAVGAVFSGESLHQDYQKLNLENNVDDIARFFYSGLSLDLFKDGSEGYWYNLLSDNPYIFIICEGEQGSMEINPLHITVNQDEATGHLESEDIVLSTLMPADLRELLERYVVDHYQPEQKKKRKRKDWLEDSLYAKGDHDKET